ncbi:hypothetical protein QTN25_006504 [Entamoeba marina]
MSCTSNVPHSFTNQNLNDDDSCDVEYNLQDEVNSNVVFERVETDEYNFEEGYDIFSTYCKMLDNWWGEDGIFQKPWKGHSPDEFFNYGFYEDTWKAYRKKQSIMKHYKNEILGIESPKIYNREDGFKKRNRSDSKDHRNNRTHHQYYQRRYDY